MILSYLRLESLVTGLRVCRGWRGVISGATPLWKKAAREIGLSEAIIKSCKPEYGSFMGLTLAAQKHRKCISAYTPGVVTQRSAFQTNFKVAGEYVICQTPHSSSDGFTTMEVKRMHSDGSLVTLHSFSGPTSRLKLHYGPFAPATSKFVFWGNCEMGWMGWNDRPQLSKSPSCKRRRVNKSESADSGTGLHEWMTNEVTNYSKTSAACPSCGMIAILAPHTSCPEGTACVLVRRLSPRCSTIEVVGEWVLQLLSNLTARSVIGFSIFPQEFEQGVCSSHYLVTEYSAYPFITLHSMPDDAQPNRELSLVQTPKKLEFSDLSTLHFSCDGSVVVTVETFSGKPEYHVWEPGSEMVIAVHLAAMGRGFKFRAIGQLYSILGGLDGFLVITTYTGEELLNVTNLNLCCSGDTSPCHPWPPVDESWLSTFAVIPDHIPIATLSSGTEKESSVAAVFARRSM